MTKYSTGYTGPTLPAAGPRGSAQAGIPKPRVRPRGNPAPVPAGPTRSLNKTIMAKGGSVAKKAKK